MQRVDGRRFDERRPVRITRDFIKYAEGSVFIEAGDTKIICTATIEDKVPSFLKGTGQGWVTAEYAMLPRATAVRNVRDATRGRISGRSSEIQRLIGRALRAAVDLKALGERTVWLDCDVIQADGGTRTLAITGSYIALVDAIYRLYRQEEGLETFPVQEFIGATSVGIVNGQAMLDLCFEEDAQAEVDMNVVMTGKGHYVELQGTAEAAPLQPAQLQELLALASKGIGELIALEKECLGDLILAIEGERNGRQ